MSTADFDIEQPDQLKRWADSVRDYEPDPLKRWAASLPKLTIEQVIEAGSKEKVAEFTKQAEILSQTPPLGVGERMIAPSVETADRELFTAVVRNQYAQDQHAKKAGYGKRLAASAVQGGFDFAMPYAARVPGSPIPKLDPFQERFRQELMGVREQEDPLIRPDTNILGRGVQQAARMMVPMVQSVGAGKAIGLASGAAKLGKAGIAFATAFGTSGSFLPQIADQTYNSLIGEGVDPDIAWRITALAAPIEAMVESILPDPFSGYGAAFRGTVRQVAGKLLKQYTVNYTKELTEEGIQRIVNETALEIGRRMDETVPDQGFSGLLMDGLEEMKDTALPLALMMGPFAAVGSVGTVSESASRPGRLGELKAIRATEQRNLKREAAKAGITGTRSEVRKKLDAEIERERQRQVAPEVPIEHSFGDPDSGLSPQVPPVESDQAPEVTLDRLAVLSPDDASKLPREDFQRWEGARLVETITRKEELRDMVELRKAQDLRGDTPAHQRKRVDDAIKYSRQQDNPDRLREDHEDWTDEEITARVQDAKEFNKLLDELEGGQATQAPEVPIEPTTPETPTEVETDFQGRPLPPEVVAARTEFREKAKPGVQFRHSIDPKLVFEVMEDGSIRDNNTGRGMGTVESMAKDLVATGRSATSYIVEWLESPPEVTPAEQAKTPPVVPETQQEAAQEPGAALDKAGISVRQTKSKKGQVGWVVSGLSKEVADGLKTDGYPNGRLANGNYYFKKDPAKGLAGVAEAVAAENAEIAAAEAEGNIRTRIGTLTPEQAESYEKELANRLADKGVPEDMVGPGGDASKPSDRAEVDPKPGTAAGPVIDQLQPIQTPELFQMAKELMGGKGPRVKKLRSEAGRFNGVEGFPKAVQILIDPQTASSEDALAQTMAHEIGHLIDFLPDSTLKRGNVLGRLQTLRDFLKTTIPPLDTKVQQRYRLQAKKNSGKDATKAQVDAEYNSLLKQAGLVPGNLIRDELIELTKWWSGDFTGAPKSYVNYRKSSRELYAEALSVLLNSPGDLEARAPTFYREFLNRLNTKPEVLDAYSTLQQMLNGTGQELAEARTQTLRDMFSNAELHISALREADAQQNKSAWSGVMDFLGQYFLTSGQPVFKRTGRKPHKSQVKDAASEAEAARYALDELFTIDSPNHTFLRSIDEQVYQPAVEMMQELTGDRTKAEAQANFMIGQFLFHHRITDERFGIANPAGFVPSASRQQLDEIKSVLGAERYAKLEGLVQKFHDLVFSAAQEAVNEGVYNREIFDEQIAPNKDNYAAFRVTHYIDDADIIATGVMQQVGTFSDIQNPFHATLLKVVRLNRLIELNRAKNRVRVFLNSKFPKDIAPVETDFKNRPKKKPAKGKDHLMELVDGKPTYFEVPTEIAKSFSMHDIGGLGKLAALNNIAYKIFHPLYVTYNPGFVMANPFRDLRRTWVNLGATNDISLGKLLHEWVKSIPTARRRANGIEDSVIREMIDSHALDVPYVDISAEGIGEEIDGLFKRHGLRPESKPMLQRIPVIGRLLELIEHAGSITETATKVASWRALEQAGVPLQERAYTVRKYAGTPDYKQRGLATPITNSMMMYSRVRWNGLSADIGLATNPTTAAGYWWRQVVNVILPTSMAKIAAYGGFGLALRAMFGVSDDDEESAAGKVATWTDDVGKRVAKYFLTDYDVFPIGVNGDGKAVFLTIPRDDLGRFIARAWWHITDAAQLSTGQELLGGKTGRDVVGESLTDVKQEVLPPLSPPLEIASKWLQYASNINPIDSHYNQQIIPRKHWSAGGWASDSKMVAWTLDKFGTPGAVLHYAASPLLGEAFETSDSGGTEAIMKTAGALTGVKRFLRISDSGLRNEQWAAIENADQEKSAFRMGLPKSAQKATTQRYFLMRRQAIGDELSKKERPEKWELDLFYNIAYVPLRKMIQESEDAGLSSEQFRGDMDQAAKDPRGMLKNPPDSLEEVVADYRRNVTYLAGFTPERKDYKSDETFSEKVASIDAAKNSLKEIGLTHVEAQELLVEHYWQPTGKGNIGTELTPGYFDRAKSLDKTYGKPEGTFKKWRTGEGLDPGPLRKQKRAEVESSYRPDGTKKGTGFLGTLKLPGGGEASEYSIGVGFDGKETLIPSLVPTLTAAERNLMINDIIPGAKDVPAAIIRKAVTHAKKRMKAGKSVWAN